MSPHKLNKGITVINAFVLMLSISYSATARAQLTSAQTVPPAAAQDQNIHIIKDAGLQFELPKGWTAENQSNGNIFLSFQDGACNVTFLVDDDYNGIVAGMKIGLKEKLTDLKFDGAPKEDTHNSMVHISETGSGRLQDVKITWGIDVLKATKPVTILTFGVDSVLQAHLDDYRKLIESIRKIQPEK